LGLKVDLLCSALRFILFPNQILRDPCFNNMAPLPDLDQCQDRTTVIPLGVSETIVSQFSLFVRARFSSSNSCVCACVCACVCVCVLCLSKVFHLSLRIDAHADHLRHLPYHVHKSGR